VKTLPEHDLPTFRFACN